MQHDSQMREGKHELRGQAVYYNCCISAVVTKLKADMQLFNIEDCVEAFQ